MAFSRAWSLLLVVWALGSGCESRVSLGQSCQAIGSCAAGLLCEFGRCRAQCESADDCTGGALCIGEPGVCTLVSDRCEASCPEGLVCAGAVCAIPCDRAGCRAGSICEEDLSVCVAAPSIDAGAPDAGMDAGDPDAGSDAPEALDAPEAVDAPEPIDAPPDTASTDAGSPDEHGRSLCAGRAHACVIRDGSVYCWGDATSGQLGDSTTSTPLAHDGLCTTWNCNDRPELPVRRSTGGATPVPLTDVVAISCATDTTCALTVAGTVWCWGGTGEVLGHGLPSSYADYVIPSGARSVEMGRDHGCARMADGYHCWGTNARRLLVDGGEAREEDGRLGSVGPSTVSPRRAPVFDGASDLALGGLFTCRRGTEGVRCVGTNEADVTGLGRAGVDPVGSLVAGLPSAIDDMTASVAFACAIGAGTAHCWGAHNYAALGRPGVPACAVEGISFYCDPAGAPVARGFDVRDEVLVALSRGQSDTTCALTRGGRALCWGWNEYGQAGVDGAPSWPNLSALSSYVSSAPMTPLEGIDEVACGAAFCCALAGAEVWCWGENDFGQLGTGTTDSRDVDAGLMDGTTLALPHPYAQRVDFSGI